jgi:hypothetical protein
VPIGKLIVASVGMLTAIAEALLAVIKYPASDSATMYVVPVCALISAFDVATGNRSDDRLLTYICVPSHSTACGVIAESCVVDALKLNGLIVAVPAANVCLAVNGVVLLIVTIVALFDSVVAEIASRPI